MIKVLCILDSKIEQWYSLYESPTIKSTVEKGKYYYVKEVDWNSRFREIDIYIDSNLQISLDKYNRICFKSINEIRSNNLDKILGND